MTEKYIESSCGLTNGVRFEELIVDTFYTDGKPKIYKVVCSYTANPYANGPADKVEDRIYFDGRGGKCYWGKDSATNGVYKNFGVSRERIDGLDLYSARMTIKCPLKFKPNTWYYVDFRDQRYEAYLYIDSNMTYNLSKIDKPTNF